ncbi:hypothetical protein [Spirosoma harenae]
MIVNHFLLMGLGPPHPQSSRSQSGSSSILTKRDSHIELIIDGHTRRYDNVNDCQFTEQGTTQFWYLNVGFGTTTYLSIALCGDCQGIFSLGNNPPEQSGMGVMTYSSSQFIYSSYGSTAWVTSESILTHGQVIVERFDRNRLVELTFTGTLLSLSSGKNPDRTVSISGHVCLNRS